MKTQMTVLSTVVVLATCLARDGQAQAPHKVTIDRERRCVLVDGKPFFALACYGIDEGHLQQAKDMGFNITCRWGDTGGTWYRWLSGAKDRKPEVMIRQFLDAVQQAGLMAMEYPELLAEGDPAGEAQPFPKFRSFIKTKVPAIVDAVKDHPALFGYCGPDEPNLWDNYGATPEQSGELLAQLAKAIRSRDPNHPVYLGFANPTIRESWSDAFDIAGAHLFKWYYTPLGLAFAGNPPKTLHCARSESAKCERLGKPYWHIALLDPYYQNTPFNCRMIASQEQRLEAYLAIIGGSKGMIWWRWAPSTQAASSGLKSLLGELNEISPALMERTPKTEVKYAPDDLRPALPLLIKNYQGKAYIITANCGRFPVDARFTLPPTTGGGDVEVLFVNRRLKIENGKFGERMDAMDARVYRLAQPWPEGGRLEVALTPQPIQDAGPTADLKRLVSLGGPNLISDPRFANAKSWQPRIEKEADRDTAAKGEIAKDARSGEAALHLRTSAQEKKNICFDLQAPTLLQARSRYLFAVRGRVWTESIVVARAGLRAATNKDQSASGWISSGAGAWLELPELGLQPETIGMTFVTGTQPFSVKPVCRLISGPGEAWFHEVIIKKLPNSKNILRNSGFEQEGAPGEPRYWGTFFGTPPVVEGDSDPCWALDRKEKHDGTMSLRLSHPKSSKEEWMRGETAEVVQHIYYGFQKGDELTLSFYAKADKSGVNLAVRLQGAGNRIFHLTPEWQRYTLPLKAKEKDDQKDLHFVMGGVTPGKAWIDAVQLEVGAQATACEEGGW